MAEIVVKIPDELERKIKVFPEVNWSELATDFFRSKVFELELRRSRELQRAMFETLASKSKLTREGALEIGKKINESMFRDLKANA